MPNIRANIRATGEAIKQHAFNSINFPRPDRFGAYYFYTTHDYFIQRPFRYLGYALPIALLFEEPRPEAPPDRRVSIYEDVQQMREVIMRASTNVLIGTKLTMSFLTAHAILHLVGAYKDSFQGEIPVACSLPRRLAYVVTAMLESAVWDLLASVLIPGGVAKLSQHSTEILLYDVGLEKKLYYLPHLIGLCAVFGLSGLIDNMAAAFVITIGRVNILAPCLPGKTLMPPG